jgi:hypothetical protein
MIFVSLYDLVGGNISTVWKYFKFFSVTCMFIGYKLSLKSLKFEITGPIRLRKAKLVGGSGKFQLTE